MRQARLELRKRARPMATLNRPPNLLHPTHSATETFINSNDALIDTSTRLPHPTSPLPKSTKGSSGARTSSGFPRLSSPSNISQLHLNRLDCPS